MVAPLYPSLSTCLHFFYKKILFCRGKRGGVIPDFQSPDFCMFPMFFFKLIYYYFSPNIISTFYSIQPNHNDNEINTISACFIGVTKSRCCFICSSILRVSSILRNSLRNINSYQNKHFRIDINELIFTAFIFFLLSLMQYLIIRIYTKCQLILIVFYISLNL